MLLDTSIIIYLIECLLLNIEHPGIIVRKRLRQLLGLNNRNINICTVFKVYTINKCREQPCYISRLSFLEFTKVFLTKALISERYLGLLKHNDLIRASEDILNELIEALKVAGVTINLINLEQRDIEKAKEFLRQLKWNERVLRRRSFDLLLFAQAVIRGVKIFTSDRGFVEIRDKVIQPVSQTNKRDRSTGLDIIEDDFVLYIPYRS